MRTGLSSDCTLGLGALAIAMGGKEHPCDRCNMDRGKCRGYPRLDEPEKPVTEKELDESFNEGD